jgi:hypothetical protein
MSLYLYLCPEHSGIKTKVHGPSVLLATGPPIGPREQGSGYPRAFQQQVAAKGKQRSLLVDHCLSAIYRHFSLGKKKGHKHFLFSYILLILISDSVLWWIRPFFLLFRFWTLSNLCSGLLRHLPFAVLPLFAVWSSFKPKYHDQLGSASPVLRPPGGHP